MRKRTSQLTGVAIVVVLCGVAHAQWISHPAPGAPRLADGRVDLKAAAPRTADGGPDLSGVWRNMRVLTRGPIREPFILDYEYFLAPDSKIAMRPLAEALYRTRLDNFGAGVPSERCLPHSVPHQLAIANPFQVIQTPSQTTFLFE